MGSKKLHEKTRNVKNVEIRLHGPDFFIVSCTT